MHFRNSWTRSTSRCDMRQVPSGASGWRGVNGVMPCLDAEVPRDVGHEIPDQRERLHRLDRDRRREVERVEPRHAHQPRLAVDLRRAGAALAGLAVPAHREIVGLLGLDAVHRVEHDHAFADLGRVVAERPLLPIAAPDSERRLGHVGPTQFSWMICCSSGGSGGIGVRDTSIAPSGAGRTPMLNAANALSFSGIVLPEMPAAAFLALERRSGDRLRDDQQVAEILRRVPAAVVLAMAGHAGPRRALASARRARSSASQHLVLLADDADEVLHHALQILLDLERILARRAAVERRQRPLAWLASTCRSSIARRAVRLRERRRMLAGTLAEHQQVRQRIAAEPVGAVDAGRALAGGEQARHASTSASRRPPSRRPSRSAWSGRSPSARR